MRRGEPFGHRLAMTPADQRPHLPGNVLHDGVVLRPLVPPDVNDVTISLRRDHARPSALVLQHGIGGDRRAVEQVVHLRHGNALARAKLLNAIHHRQPGLCSIGQDDVREGSTDVDANQNHGSDPAVRISRCKIVCSNTRAPRIQSSAEVDSCGEWLTPPMLGTKIIPIGPIRAII